MNSRENIDTNGDVSKRSETVTLGGLLELHGVCFVEHAYRGLLLRDPDESGLQFYIASLLNGTPKIQILSEIAQSPEARNLAAVLPGLATAVRRYRLSKIPILGAVVRLIFPNVEANSVFARRLRSVEQELYLNSRNIELLLSELESVGKEGSNRAPTQGRVGLARAIPTNGQPLPHADAPNDPAALTQCSDLQSVPVTVAEIRCLKFPQVTGEASLFVTHSADGNIKPHVAHYLAALKRHGISVVLIVAADRPVESVEPGLMSLVSGLFVRENKGYDFAAWAHVLQLHPALFASPILYLMNDSLFGPLNDEKFASVLRRIRFSRADVVGLTDSYEHNWHVQSFFLAFKPKALSSVVLHRFINSIRCFSDKDAVIKSYELTLSTQLRARGLEIEVLFASTDIVDHGGRQNRTLFNWKELLSDGFPFVKVQVLRDTSLNIDSNDSRAILSQEGYDVSLVDNALSKMMPKPEGEIRAPNHTTNFAPLVSVPRFTSSEPPRVAFIGPWNYDNGLGFASRGYVSALWHTGFSVNLHPIRGPFHTHRRITPTVDVRTFSGDPDLAVVHLNPDAWPGLLSEEHRSILSNARKTVGIWVWETTRIPDNWRPMFDSVDAIWAPSKYCADVFATSAKVPVDVVQHVIGVRESSSNVAQVQSMRTDMGIVGDARVILYCFDGASYLARKNPFALISGFTKSGLAQEGWVLVLKTKNLFDSPAQGLRLQEEARRHWGVILIDRSFDQAMMNVLMDVADIYASPHCSEGFGMTIAEAMAAGKLVVATDYGGSRDFLDETCGYPVRYSLHTLDLDHGHYTRGSIWADIDEVDLARALRKAAERVACGDLQVGQTARSRIGLQYSPQAVGRVMRRAAETLLKDRV